MALTLADVCNVYVLVLIEMEKIRLNFSRNIFVVHIQYHEIAFRIFYVDTVDWNDFQSC